MQTSFWVFVNVQSSSPLSSWKSFNCFCSLVVCRDHVHKNVANATKMWQEPPWCIFGTIGSRINPGSKLSSLTPNKFQCLCTTHLMRFYLWHWKTTERKQSCSLVLSCLRVVKLKNGFGAFFNARGRTLTRCPVGCGVSCERSTGPTAGRVILAFCFPLNWLCMRCALVSGPIKHQCPLARLTSG